MMFPVIRASMARTFGPELHGVSFGLVSMVETGCQAFAPAAASALWSRIELRHLDHGLAFFVLSALCVAGLLVFAAIPSRYVGGAGQPSARRCEEALCSEDAQGPCA